MADVPFEGFKPALLEFLANLAEHNTREWFVAHDAEYQDLLMQPARDKSPYKTHLDLWFWQGNGPSRERPGYFFRLTPECLTLGAGMHAFSDTTLERYRHAVLDDGRGLALEAAAQAIGLELGGKTYKRVPAGLPIDHPRADWLRYSGLFAAVEQPVPDELFSAQLPPLCLTHFQRLAPLQQWLVDLLPD